MANDTIDFDSDRWEIEAAESRVETFKGQKCLFLKGGSAILKDVEMTDGIIEFDIAFPEQRGFVGCLFRLSDERNFEYFYFRPHQSGNPDATQYTPVFNGSAAWQLYFGEGFAEPVTYVFDEWMPVRLVVSGGRAEIYVRDMEKPAMHMHDLKRETKAGKVGVIAGGAQFTPARFANFRVTPMTNVTLKSPPREIGKMAPNTVAAWQISDAFNAKKLENVLRLSNNEKQNLGWDKLEVEPSGLANIARLRAPSDSTNAVFAKLDIESDKEQIKKLDLAFSDIVKVYFNDTILFSAEDVFQSRDYRFLGSIGYFDHVYLPLKKGDNEVWIAVIENFGGWGIKGLLE
jgi:hypothetical protein